MNPELTIVIPAKNEEKLIGTLLESVVRQDYPRIHTTKIYVADAQSTDRTREIVQSFKGKLDIEVIEGGPVAIGRNNGAVRARSEFVLFLDGDMDLGKKDTLKNAVEVAKRKKLDCVGAYVKCKNGNLFDNFLYGTNNFVQFLSKFVSPFATGMFMLFRKSAFDALGGFDTKTLFGEDYILSSKVPPKRFTVKGYVLTTNRRFKRIGYGNMIRMMFLNILHFRDKDYIASRDYKNYWD